MIGSRICICKDVDLKYAIFGCSFCAYLMDGQKVFKTHDF